MAKKKLTPKQRVLKKYPEAVCLRDGRGRWDVWHRIDSAGWPLGTARAASNAWKLAAMRIAL